MWFKQTARNLPNAFPTLLRTPFAPLLSPPIHTFVHRAGMQRYNPCFIPFLQDIHLCAKLCSNNIRESNDIIVNYSHGEFLNYVSGSIVNEANFKFVQ